MRHNKEEKRHTAAEKVTNSKMDPKYKFNDVQVCDISLLSTGKYRGKAERITAHQTAKIIILQVKSNAVMCKHV
jgi:hypothetical protein